MKVMEGSMETEDSAMTVPLKKKKLIQALLPFQTLGSSATPSALSNKKRKHMSPSPGDNRNPKVVKVTAKENSEETKISDRSVNEKRTSEANTEIVNVPTAVSKDSAEGGESNAAMDASPSEGEKTESKVETKSVTVNKDTICSTDANAARKGMPIVLLSRCDDSKCEVKVGSCAVDDENVDKAESMRSNESTSSNEELAKELDDSECDVIAKGRSDISSDDTDSDSIGGILSSEDETEERKRNKENEMLDNKNTPNGTSLDRTPTSGVKSDSKSAARRRLTPKQLEKQMKTTKRREEQRARRLEKEKKRKEERLNRVKEKEARRREKKEKEEAEKEQKRKEKEQKELKKQMEIEQKQKEKERKDRAKEEDRKKREEERLEAERKKQRAASTFASFFVPKKPEAKLSEEKEQVRASNFMPFEIKADMRVAPVCRRSLNVSERTEFDTVCIDKLSGNQGLYVEEIKTREKRKSGKTWPPESKDDDIIAVEDDELESCNMVDQPNAIIEKHRPKLLAFAENRRPPYWGTWRKLSVSITPRRPFSKDTKWFDYDVDSDEEWEEEEPGESLHGSDDEKDEENPDDNEYDVDNEFMVPHGYLSDEEAAADEDEEDMSPETQKFKLKILGEEFEAERQTQPSKIKPKVLGCIWQGPVNAYPKNTPERSVDYLTSRQAWVRETPIVLAPPTPAENTSVAETSGTTGEERRGAKKTRVPDEALPELIRLIHGNSHGHSFLVREFMTFWNRKKMNAKPLSKSSIGQKIREFARRMACPEEGPMHLRACWYVSEDVRREYLGDENLVLPNRWSYALTPKRKTLMEVPRIPEKVEKDEKERERKSAPLITQYTKKITQEEMKRQLDVKSSGGSSPRPSTSATKTPKRAQLISVARGQDFPRTSIMSAFTKAQLATCTEAAKSTHENIAGDACAVSREKNDAEKSAPVLIELDCSTDSTTK